MNKKQTTYLLFVIVALIWAGVIYQFASYYSDDTPGEGYNINNQPIKETDKIINPTYHLIIDYRDPFLNTNNSNKEKHKPFNHNLKKIKSKTIEKQNQPNNLPTIIVNGFIQNTDEGEDIVIISINNNVQLMKEGDSVLGITITNIDYVNKSITYEFQNKKYEISNN
jgi:hypothetical protein